MAVMCSSALMFNVCFISSVQTASQFLQFGWYTALFLSFFDFDVRLLRVVLGDLVTFSEQRDQFCATLLLI